MKIDNNLNAMISGEFQMNQMMSNIAQVSNVHSNTQTQEVSQELIDSIVGQIPQVVSYEANANSIKTQNEVSDMLLNLKA